MPSISDAVQSATANVQAAAGSVLSGVSGATQAAQAALAPNAWVGSADNKLATADPYNPPSGPAIITDIENLFQKFDFSITDVLRGGKFIAQEAGAVAAGLRGALRVAGQIQRGVQMLSQGDIMSRILGASVLTKGALNGLGLVGLGNIAQSINSGITTAEGVVGQAYGQVSNQIYSELNGVVQQVSSAYADGLQGLGQCINSLGINASFNINDVGVKVGLFSGLIQTASGYGIPNSFGSLVATITDRNVLGQITMKVMPSIISNSDVMSLQSIGARLGAGSAYAYNPNILGDFSQAYFVPPPAAPNSPIDYSTCFSNLTDAYDSVDPNWKTLNRETTITDAQGNDLTQTDPAFNLNAVMNGSSDFQTVMSQGCQTSTNRTDKLMALAPAIQQSTVADKLASQFPLTVFSGNGQSGNDVQDPVALAQGTPAPTVPTNYPTVAPNTGKPNYDIQADGIHNVQDAKLENGVYVWPDGYFQVGATHQGADGQGYVSKGITFN